MYKLIINWETYIECVIPRLILACFAIRTVKPLLKIDTLTLVYFACFCAIMSCVVIFWGNS